ncbi:polyprenol reductase [Galendromus occidentalis]|uniref:Polyprenal reductase n=1 Tax=Galendromus occidentalis TaxID=34638 RepID=A0AAJ6QPD2_9ACAR|nr:polyprenol reductase [Galendromus occidentalis]
MINLLDVLWSSCTFPLWITYLFLVHRPEKVSDLLVSAFLYGKLSSNNKKAGRLNNIAIPKRWFTHFYQYAVVLFSLWSLILLVSAFTGHAAVPSSLSFSLDVLIHNRRSHVPFAVALWVQLLTTLQVYRRCYECMFVSVYSDAKMHVWHYAVGYIFYTGIQYSILSMTLGSDSSTIFRFSDLFRFNVLIGTLIFAAAFHLEHDTTKRFANFRKDATGKVVSSKHQAPVGGMFEYVSSPHYLAEMLVYTGLTVILWSFNFTWFNALLWTYVNQSAMAFLSHRWYQSNFKDYPKTRTAVIPFLL